jgi:hypothetical protein
MVLTASVKGGESAVPGGKLKIIAAIEEPLVIGHILADLGLAAKPARRIDL